MSTLYVDNLQPNLGNQVEIPNLKPLAGAVVNTTRWTTSSFNGSGSTNAYVALATLSLTAKAGNIIQVSGVFPTRGAASSGWNLTLIRLSSNVDGVVWNSGYDGQSGTAEIISNIPINGSWVWGGTGENTHTISLEFKAYAGITRYYGSNNQDNTTTTPVLTFLEIAQ